MLYNNVEEFAKSAVICLYDLELIGMSCKEAVAGLQSEINELLQLNDVQTLERRHRRFQIPQTSRQDYEEQFYELDADKKCLAGIRHFNGLIDQPFVHMLLDFIPASTEIELLKTFAQKQFKRFAPRFVSLCLRPSLQFGANTKSVTSGRQYLAASLSDIQNKPSPSGSDRITLVKGGPAFDFEWYSEAYRDFHLQQPELKDRVPITDKEDIERSISEGLLHQVFIDGELAGFIAGHSEPLLGVPSVYMTELLLLSKYKGQQLAVPLQRKFLDQLPTDLKLVWGTIDSNNLPSLKTALRVGRSPIRAEYFIELA